MQYSKKVAVAALAAAVPMAAGLSISDLPECAVTNALAIITADPCGLTISCVCKNTAEIALLIPAIEAGCSSTADRQLAADVAYDLCTAEGITITIPGYTRSGTSTTAAAVTTTAAAATTAAAVTTTAAAVTTTAAAVTTTAAAVTTTKAAGNGTSTTSSTSTKYTGAANTVAGSAAAAGLIGMVAFAMGL